MWKDICNCMFLRNVSQVVSLQREVVRLESALQQQLLTVQHQTSRVNELAVSFTRQIPEHFIIRLLLL